MWLPLDWIAAVLCLIGIWLIGNKKKVGFLIYIVENLVWILFVYFAKVGYGLWFVCTIAIVINTRNYFKWRKDEKNCIGSNLTFRDRMR